MTHKPVEVVQHDSATQGTFQDSLNYNSATETAGIFDGISVQPVHSKTSQTATAPATTTTHSGDQNQSAPVQNSDSATQAKSEAKTATVSVTSSAKISAPQATISAVSATASSNAMTQQLAASLTTANGPPASSSVSQTASNQAISSNSSSSTGSSAGSSSSPAPRDSASSALDLLQSISNALAAIGSGTTPDPINLGDATLAGILSAHDVELSFSGLTISDGVVTVGTVTLAATSASVNLGGAVTSTIGAITGTYDIASKTFSLTLNSVAINFSSFVNITADSVNLTYDASGTTSVNITDGTNTSTKDVSVLTLGINNASIFVGVNGPADNSGAVGVELTGANLALALMSADDGTVYYGVRASAASLSDVGLPDGFHLSSTDLQININGSTDGSNAVDFDSSFTPGTGLTVETGGDPVNLDYTGQIIQAFGTIDLSFNGFVYIHGSMAIQSQDSTSVTLTDGTNTMTKTVSELTIGASDVTIFAGMNGPSDNSGAVGVELDNAGFALALFTGTDGKVYYGLQTTVGVLEPVGLPDGFEMHATDLNVQINSSNDGNNVVDFKASFGDDGLAVQTGPSSTVNLDYTNQFFQASGTIELDFDGFVYISGSFAILSQPGATVTLTDGTTTTTKTVSELTIGADGVTIFAGMNGPSTNPDAVGVELDDAGFALALFTGTDGKVYYGLQTTVGTLEAVGLPEGFEMSATDLQVQVNGSNDGNNVVDFKASFGDDGLAVQTGPSTSVNLDYTTQFFQASGTIELDFDGFVYIKGSFAILSQPSATVTLTDGTDTTTKTVSELTIGADGVTIFAGMNGPSTNPDAVGVELDDAGFALALFSGTDGKVYYGLETTVGTLKAVGLPDGFEMSATDLQVQINSSNDGNNVVDFKASFGDDGLAVQTGPSTSVNLDYTNQFFQASGTIELDFDGFVYIKGSFAILSQPSTTVTLTDGTTTTTKTVSELTIGADSVTIFAGINGPSTNPDAVGVELDNANLALALFTGTDGKVYYGVVASATLLAGVGLPGSITIGAGDLDVQVNGSNDGDNVVDFKASFGDDGLAVQTGPSTSVNLNFTESYLRVAGSLDLGLADVIHISGGFSFTQTPDEIDINVGHTAFDGAEDLNFVVGSEDSPVFSASGFLSMTITSTALTISEASMTIDSLKIGSILEADSLTVAISNLSINLATGEMSGVTDGDGVHDPILTVTVASATLFPGNTSITGGVSPTEDGDGLGFQGIFDLSTGAFSITLEKFHLAVGTVFTADASDVLISYNPDDPDPHQQLVQIGDATLDFKFGANDITGNVTNLTIYKDGFHFDSVTIAYIGTINLGSILTITNPSVTLTDFGMTFGGSVSANGSLTVSAASASLNVGTAFTASTTNLSVTIALDPDHLGDTTVTAGTVSVQFGTVVSFYATNVGINTNPADGEAYLSIGTATATLNVGTVLSATGSAAHFSLINDGGSVALREDDGFNVSITVTPGQLNLPTWLGFQITKFEVQWDNFADHPDQFKLILSASINSISGLPDGVTVSGEITDAVIDTAKLEAGDFPITSIGSVGGSIKGTLFGLEVNAAFVMGVINFNADGNIVNADGSVTHVVTNPDDGSVIETTIDSNGIITQTTTHPNGTVTTTHPTSGITLDTTVTGSTMYVGVAGGAEIPGVGGVQIYIGFSSLGPLTFYLSAEFPLILDPDTGIAIGGFSGGVIFNYSLPTPDKPQDLSAINITQGSVTISQWQQQLRQQTINQYLASDSGTNLTAAYNQPFVIEAGVTLYDAYATENAFSVTGNIAIQIDPAHTDNVKIFVAGTATFGDTVSFNAYLYLNVDASNPTPTVTVMFLVQEPADTPVETFGGALTFGFTDSDGNPLTPTAATTETTQTITLSDGTTSTYTATQFTPSETAGGFYLSIDGFASFSAFGTLTATISGSVTLTVTDSFAKIDLSGSLSISNLGDLATASGELVVDYSNFDPDTFTGLEIYGALKLETGNAFAKLEGVGLHLDGAATFILNTTDSPQTVYLPDPDHPHIAADATEYDITDTRSFEVLVAGVDDGTFATLDYEVSGDTVLSMEGAFDLKIDSSGLTMFADINSLVVGPSDTPFLTLSGNGLFVINNQGFAAEMDLNLSAQAIEGISLTADFTLVMNTTSTDIVYTIPDGLPPVTIPGTSTTVTEITIPRGPPQGLLQSNGTFASTGATGPYVVITGKGDLDVYDFNLSGFFYFQLSDSASGPSVSLIVSVSGDLGFGTVNVTGGFQLSSAGFVGLLQAGGSTGSPTDFGAGISLELNAELAINTTGSDVDNIGGIPLTDSDGNPITITARSAEVIASGTMTLTFGTGSLVIDGVFSTSEVDTGSDSTLVQTTTITLGGTLTATVSGSTLLTMDVSGVMVFVTGAGATHPGMAGELTMTIGGGSNPLSGSGFSFSGTFDLEVNTTGVSQNVMVGTSTVTISGGPNGQGSGGSYAEIHAQGSLTFGTATNAFALNNASFYLLVSSSGLEVSAGATMAVIIGGNTTTLGSVTGALLISSSGFAGSLTVTATLNDPSGHYGFNGSFNLQINTTGQQQEVNSITIPAGPGTTGSPAGPYFQMHITGSLALGSTDTSASTVMLMTGDFYVTISSGGLAITASATLNLKILGTNIFSFTANGALLLNSDGIAAKITLTISAGSSGTGFGFDASVSFRLELNTSMTAVNVINNVAVNLPGGPYFKVIASGKLVIANVVDISGSFTLTVDSSGVEVEVSATLNLFGNVFTVQGGAGIYSNGIAINITLGFGGSTSPTVYLIPGVVAVSGSFQLQINTTGTSHLGVDGGTAFEITIANAAVYVFGFKMASASLNITVLTDGTFYSSGTLSFDFFGFISLDVTFNFDSKGNYYFEGHIYVQVGPSGFNIHGNLTVIFSNEPGHPNFELDVNGGVTAFGIDDIISADVNVTISGSSVDMSVWAGITIPMPWPIPDIHIGGTVHIHLGSLNVPTQPPPPPLASVSSGTITVDGQNFGDGTLLLFLGSYADSNRTGVPAESDENYTITLKSVNDDGTVNVLVSAPGVTGQTIEYDNVKRIVVPDAGTSNTVVQIDNSITIPVTIFAGSGTNQFYLGGGTSTVNGSTGNDTVFGGTGGVTFNAGSGSSVFQGGGTGSTHNYINDPGSVTVIESGYNSYSLVGTDATNATFTYGGNINTLSGDSITVTMIGASSGAQTFSISNYWGTASIDRNGNTDTVTTSVTVDNGNLTLDGNVVTETNGVTGNITLNNINSVGLYGGSAANTFTINSWSGTGGVTLDGKGGNDIYNINFQSSGSFTATVSDTGLADSDSLIVNGTTGADTIHLSDSAVSFGSQTVNYSGIESLTLYTKTGGDTVDITGIFISTATTINTGSGANTINIGTNSFTTNTSGNLNSVNATLTINGGGTDTLNLDDTGDSSANTGTLTSSTLAGIFGNGSLNYSSVETFNLNLGSGGNTFTIQSTSTGATNINSGSGSDTVNVQATTGATGINTGAGTNTVYIGSTAPTAGGLLKNIKGALTITGGGTTTLNADDTGDVSAASGTLTGTTLKGFGMGSSGITYSGIATLVISLGNGGNTFTITNTNASTDTTLNSGNGNDTVNITTDSGATTVNAQDGIDTINVTNDGGTTTINGGNGNDTVNLLADSATTNIYGDANDDIINIQTTGATTNVNTGTGTNTINIGSNAPSTSGNISGIQGAINITGSATDILNVDDTGYASGRNGASAGYLTSTALTGLGMAGGINYSGILTLNISFGSGDDTLNVQSTYSGTTTTVNTGTGTNTVTVTNSGVLSGIAGKLVVNGQGTDTMTLDDTADSGSGTLTQTTTTLKGLGMGSDGIQYSSIETLNINLGTHNNTIYIQGNPSVTTENLNTGSGTNTICIGSNAQTSIVTDTNDSDWNDGDQTNYTGSVLDDVQGIINITGSGNDTMVVDDSGSTAGENGGLWSNKLQFLDPVTINFTGIAAISISLSQDKDQFAVVDTITSASVSPVVVIDGNSGGDTFIVFDTHATATINGGDGGDSFYNFGNSSVLNLNGNAGDDSFYIYASVSEETTNVGPGAADSNGNQVYSYRSNAEVNIDGGTGNDTVFIFGTVLNDVITISGTNVSGAGLNVNYTDVEQLVVAGLGGDDTFYIESISIPTTIIGDGTIVLPGATQFLEDLGIITDPEDLLTLTTGGVPPSTSFNDTFYVGWQGQSYIPGSLAGITAPLTIDGDDGTGVNTGSGTDTIYVDDSADTANQNFTLTSTDLTGGGFGNGGRLIYDNETENLNFHVGNGNNTITIDGNDTASQTSIYGGNGDDTFIVNDDPLQAPLALFGGLNTFVGDTLIVNGDCCGNDFTITGFTIDGAGATISYEQFEELIINAGGATTFTVNGDSIPTYLNGGDDSDSFIVNSSVVPLYLDGGNGCDTFTINGNSGALTVTGDAGDDTITVNGNGGSMVLSGGDDNDFFTINGNSGVSLVLNGDDGDDCFVVNAIGSPTTINGGADNDSVTVNTPLAAMLTVNGGGDACDTLTVNGTLGNDYFTITGTSVNGVGSAINYSAINSLIVNAGLGDDTFLVLSDSVNTTLNGGAGNDLFYIRSTNGATCVNTGSGINTVDIGSYVPYPNSSVLDYICGTVNVIGNGSDTLNIDDTASTIDKFGTLTSDSLTGLCTAGINYCGIQSLNLLLGSGSDTLNIQSTNGVTNTIVNTGAGCNTINIGSNEPSGCGVVDYICGPLTIIGSGNDTMNVDDTGSTVDKSGALTPTTLTGLGMGASGIVFSGLSALNISLGSGNDTFLIVNTPTATTSIWGNCGDDTFNVRITTGILNLDGGLGNDTFNFGSLAPSIGGTLNNLAGVINIAGDWGCDTVNLDDTADTADNAGTLTNNSLTGLGFGGGLNYCTVENLNINLGSGNDTFNVQSTNCTTVTALNTGAGWNTINLGSLSPAAGGIVDGIQGKLIIIGNGSDTMNVDDTGSADSKTGTLTYNSLTGLGMGACGIVYSGLATLTISLGSGGNTFTIDSTNVCTVTTLNSGSGTDTVNLLSDSDCTYINGQNGNDVINIQSTGAMTTVNTGAGTNTINIGSNAPSANGLTSGIQGALIIIGSGSDTMNVDDTGDIDGLTGFLTYNTLTGLGMGDCGITYCGLTALNINLGGGDDTVNVLSNYWNTTTTINTGAGANTINVGSLAPATGGIVDCVQGALVVIGSGNDMLNVDDTGSTVNKTGTLTPTTITGLGMGEGGITYSGLAVLNITLGCGDDTFYINDITNSTATTVDGGIGVNTAVLYFSGDFSAMNLTLLNFQTATLDVVGNFSGLLNDYCDALTTVTIGGSFTSCGVLNAGSIGTMTVGCNFSGTLNVCGSITSLSIGGSFTSCGVLNAASIDTLAIGCNFAGTINVGGAITTFTIGGSFTYCGILNASSIDTMTVGDDFTGQINVTGLLNSLTVDGRAPGAIIAGDVNVITVLAGYGNVLLNVTEGGIQREILATPVNGGCMSDTVTFAFVYDSQTAADAQLAIRITDSDPVARSFNLALKVVNSSTAKFNLTRIDSYLDGMTGISNISVWGDLLMQLTAPELQLFTDLTASSPAGVVLPVDNITGVEISGILPVGFINVAGLEGLAFGTVTTAAGKAVKVSNPIASGRSLVNLLGSDAVLNPATDEFVVPFNETHNVTLFVCNGVTSNLTKIVTFTDEFSDNLAITAYVQVLPTTDKKVQPLVQCIRLDGAGASIDSTLSVANIFSNGAIGDIIIEAKSGATVNDAAGLGNVTATSIFGDINVKNAGIYGIIQTTDGDIGQLTTSSKGKLIVTTISAKGDITGQIISRGSIISSITTKGSFTSTGVIAAQGDIGTIQYDSDGNAIVTSKGLVRFGGISIGKNDSGQIIALGNIFGDITVKKTMTGQIAAQGALVNGLPETEIGILGKVTIGSFATGSAIISGGQIGDATGKVMVKLGKAQGFVAAAGFVNIKTSSVPANNLLPSQTGSNLEAINAIFTDADSSLLFDTGGSLNGLMLIEIDLANIQDNSGVLSGVIL